MAAAEWCLRQSVWASLHERIRRQYRRPDTDDLLQTALLLLFERGTADIAHPEAYILRTARNLAIDRARREKCVSITTLHSDDRVEPVCQVPGPERILLGREQLERVRAAFLALDTRTARIFLMSRLEAMPYSRIASALTLSVSTVEKSVARALTHLALALTDRPHHDA